MTMSTPPSPAAAAAHARAMFSTPCCTFSFGWPIQIYERLRICMRTRIAPDVASLSQACLRFSLSSFLSSFACLVCFFFCFLVCFFVFPLFLLFGWIDQAQYREFWTSLAGELDAALAEQVVARRPEISQDEVSRQCPHVPSAAFCS